MFLLNIKYRTGLIFQQLKYGYIAQKNNKAIEEAFACDIQNSPSTSAIIFKQNPFLVPTVLVGSLTLLALVVLLQPISFSKQAPQKISIEKKIQKKLVKQQPLPNPSIDLEKVRISPVMQKPTISRETFINKPPLYTLILNKHTKKLFVTKEIENNYSLIREFPVSLGKVPGKKERKGDQKTPEGVYSLIDLKLDEELPDKYGPFAAVLNYPNENDLKQGKTGDGIWIHGTGKDQLTPDTQGCIELSDKHLIQLYSYIRKGAKIIIASEKINITPVRKIIQGDLVKLATIS